MTHVVQIWTSILLVVTAETDSGELNIGLMSAMMSATVAFNEARGKHQIDPTSDMVARMVKMKMKDKDICKALNMTAEELLRFKMQSGLPNLYKDEEFSRSWVKETEK